MSEVPLQSQGCPATSSRFPSVTPIASTQSRVGGKINDCCFPETRIILSGISRVAAQSSGFGDNFQQAIFFRVIFNKRFFGVWTCGLAGEGFEVVLRLLELRRERALRLLLLASHLHACFEYYLIPREQKMLKGHLPRVIYHQIY